MLARLAALAGISGCIQGAGRGAWQIVLVLHDDAPSECTPWSGVKLPDTKAGVYTPATAHQE
jgi:hypothetical protein